MSDSTSTTRRPKLAIIANAPAPYRLAQHTRIVRELPEVELHTIFKHEHNNSPWRNPLPEEINPVVFGPGEIMTQKNKGLNILKQWGRGGEIIQYLARHEIDAVIITGYNDLGLMRIIRWCKARGIPRFMFNDSNVFGDRARGLAKAFKKVYVPWILRSLTGLMPCGTRGVEYFAPYGGGALPTFYMPHEPNYPAIAAVDEATVREAKEHHGFRPDLRYINYCARMATVKRPDLLVHAFEAIADERPDWGVCFVGAGDLLEPTKALVPDHLRDRVIFTGFVDGSESVAALYKACEIHVLPSDYEPWAAVIPESCAAGLAIVSSDVVGAAAECVRDDVNGFNFRHGDADDLADKLRRATDPAHIDRYRRGTADVLRAWRQRGDPVDAVRRMLEFTGLLSPASGTKPTGDPEKDWKVDVEAGVNAFAAVSAGPAVDEDAAA